MSWVSFILACLIYLIGHAFLTGGTAGAGDVLTWYAVLIVLLLWGAVDAVLKGLSKKGGGHTAASAADLHSSY